MALDDASRLGAVLSSSASGGETKFHRMHQLPRAASRPSSARGSGAISSSGSHRPESASPENDPSVKAEAKPEVQASGRSAPVVVLRKCEDVHVRTGGFQKIEEAAHRVDRRRVRRPASPTD